MKTVKVWWITGSGSPTTFTCREVVQATDSVYLHDIESVKDEQMGVTNSMVAKKMRIPMSAVMAVEYE